MSIKSKLLRAFLTLAVLPLLLLGSTSYWISKEALEERIVSSLEIIADSKVQKISDFIEVKRQAIKIINNAESFLPGLTALQHHAKETDHPAFVAATRQLDQQLKPLQAIFNLTDIVIADPQGAMLYLSNNDHRDVWWGETFPVVDPLRLQTGETINYFQNEHEKGAFGILITSPIKAADDKVLGFIILEVGARAIQQVIADKAGLGASEITVLSKKNLDQNSYSYVTPHHAENEEIVTLAVPFAETSNPMQEAIQGRNGSGATLSCEEEEILAAWRNIPFLNMGLVTRLDRKEAFASIDHLRLFTLLFALGASIVGGSIALLIFQSFARPLLKLQQGAAAIGSGNLAYRLHSERNDEFGLLAQTFDDMAQNLQSVTTSRDELNREIAARKKAEQSLQEEHIFLQTIIDAVIDPIMVISADYQVLLTNAAARRQLPKTSPPNRRWFCHEISHHSDQPCQGDEHPCPLQQVQQTGQAVTLVHRHELENDETRLYELQASPLWNLDGTLQGIIEASRDITDRVKVEEELDENRKRMLFLAHHDDLTKLPNRWLFSDRLQQALAKARRSSSRLAVMFLDLDGFKNINDSLGHPVGDLVLREVANRLQDCLRGTDILARLGGDEFLFVIENVEDLAQIVTIVSKINQTLARPMKLSMHELTITASIGISLFPTDAVDEEGLFKCADAAMYQAKGQGRNTYHFFTSDMNERVHDRLYFEGQLRKALELEQFFLVYQPQCDMRTGRVFGVEALLRWQHPERGLVSPLDFIPLAEETGLIIPIGEWVLRTACAQAKVWQDQGHAPLLMAVNISARQFRQPGFVDFVSATVEAFGLDPHWLELEITESVIMDNVNEAIMTLTDLKARGFRLAIDDFGTGYSSLSYLKRFPIDKLKIDQSFVDEIITDRNDAAIATAIIALSMSMELEVIAEGVETMEQRDFLIKQQCHQGQGYLFSKPVSAVELTDQLQSHPSPKDLSEPGLYLKF